MSVQRLSESGTEVSDRMQDWPVQLGNIKNEAGKTDLNRSGNPGVSWSWRTFSWADETGWSWENAWSLASCALC